MSPFNGHPEGFSVASLKLLDEGLHRMLLDAQVAAEAKQKTMQFARVAPVADKQAEERKRQD